MKLKSSARFVEGVCGGEGAMEDIAVASRVSTAPASRAAATAPTNRDRLIIESSAASVVDGKRSQRASCAQESVTTSASFTTEMKKKDVLRRAAAVGQAPEPPAAVEAKVRSSMRLHRSTEAFFIFMLSYD